MNLQEQINAATPGATIRIPDGETVIGNFTIHKSLNIVGGAGSKIVSPTFDPAIKIPPGTGPVSLQGLEITCLETLSQIGVLIEFGSDSTTSLSQVPQGLTIDRCDIHGQPNTDSQRGIAANGANFKITNSKVREIHGRGYDTQAVCSWNGPGPFTLLDCYFEGAGENVMFGGAPPAIPGLVHEDIEIRRCVFFKPLSWCIFSKSEFRPLNNQSVTWTTDPRPGPEEDQTESYPPRYVDSRGNRAVRWTVKNLFELKNARRVIVDGNIFENNWTDAQAGRAIAFTPRTSDSGAAATVEDVLFQNNIIKNVGSGIILLGIDDPPQPQDVRLKRVKVLNNLWLIDGPGNGSNGAFATVIKGTDAVVIEHNTAYQTGNLMLMDYMPPSTGFRFNNNIGRHNAYGIFGSGAGVGNPAIAQYFPGSIIAGNVIAKEVLSSDSPGNFAAVYPAGNHFPDSLAEVLGSDHRVLAAWKGKATDGKDPGCDMDQLMAAIGGTAPPPQPIPVPTPTLVPIPEPVPTPPPLPATPASVSIIVPVNGDTVSGKARVTARASDESVISTAHLLVNGIVVSSTSSAPYVFDWDTTMLSDGSHWLFVRAWGKVEGPPMDSPLVNVAVANKPPAPTPAPIPEPTPTPVPEPPKPPPCTITAPASISIPRNSSRAIAVTLTNLTEPTEVVASGYDGQLSVLPVTQTARGTSAVLQFMLRTKNKRQSRTIVFRSGCGEAAVRVNIT